MPCWIRYARAGAPRWSWELTSMELICCEIPGGGAGLNVTQSRGAAGMRRTSNVVGPFRSSLVDLEMQFFSTSPSSLPPPQSYSGA
jgi:hypothetical protein